MSNNGFRLVALNGLAMILLGMFLAGMPLVFVVTQDAYHQPAPINVGGDYRGWMMAHLEGLLNGMMIIVLAAVTRFRTMAAGRERTLIAALAVGGWGNTITAILAPMFGVRGMIFDGSMANNLVAGMFTFALLGTVTALVLAILHLAPAEERI